MPFVPRFVVDGLSIILIDLLLAGDNALVIAMAARSLPPKQRKASILFGSAAAVILRVLLTFLAVELLKVEFLLLAGGALVLWIAVKVFADSETAPETEVSSRSWMRAAGYIVFADITMSLDNILAVAGASHGSIALIVFGLCVSIPFVIVSSNLLSKLLDRFPWLLYLGAAILGKVGAQMMLTDGFVERTLHPSRIMIWAGEAVAVAGVLLASSWLGRRAKQQKD